jgi:hypothetical protein
MTDDGNHVRTLKSWTNAIARQNESLLFDRPMATNAPSPAIEVDYVIVFQLPTSKAEARREQYERAEREYVSLMDTLRASGLQATGRPGAEGSNIILICVRATDERVRQEAQEEQ